MRSGSKAHGIDVEGSDDDYVGVFIPRLRDFVSMGGLERDTSAANDPDYAVHEIGKFCRLALKGTLEESFRSSALPEEPRRRGRDLDPFLVGLRLRESRS